MSKAGGWTIIWTALIVCAVMVVGILNPYRTVGIWGNVVIILLQIPFIMMGAYACTNPSKVLGAVYTAIGFFILFGSQTEYVSGNGVPYLVLLTLSLISSGILIFIGSFDFKGEHVPPSKEENIQNSQAFFERVKKENEK